MVGGHVAWLAVLFVSACFGQSGCTLPVRFGVVLLHLGNCIKMLGQNGPSLSPDQEWLWQQIHVQICNWTHHAAFALVS